MSVVWEMPAEFSLLNDLKFDLAKTAEDEQLRRWHETHDGVYANNGVLMSIMKKSRPDVLVPDLCIFALPGNFTGIYPGYSKVHHRRHEIPHVADSEGAHERPPRHCPSALPDPRSAGHRLCVLQRRQ